MDGKRREELLEHRKTLTLEYQKTSEEFDKTIITISSASLGISLAFLKDIVPFPLEWTYPILFLGWLFLILSLVAIVFSFLVAIRLREQTIETIDLELRTGKQGKVKPSRLATTLSWVSGASLVLGILFYLIFAIVNLYT